MNASLGRKVLGACGGHVVRWRTGQVFTLVAALLLLAGLAGPTDTAGGGGIGRRPGDQARLVLAAGNLQARLLPGDPSSDAEFGRSVAVSGDLALVGGPYLDVGMRQEAGAAYIFARARDGSWTATARLTAPDGGDFDFFGQAVALFGDTAVVGAPSHDVAGRPEAGAVYVFKLLGGSWVQQAKLVAADGATRSYFGRAVAIEDDTIVVGSPWREVGGDAAAGAAYVFTRSGDVWSQQARLVAADGAVEDCLGDAVAVSGDLALLGAPNRDNGARVDAGAAYSFTRAGAVWTQQALITARDGSDADNFGDAVAVSGVMAVVGAPGASVAGAAEAGAVYLYRRPGGVWAEQARLVAGDARAGIWFGFSVSFSGERLLVGAPGPTLAPYPGAAYVFAEDAGSWSQHAQLAAAIAGHDAVGWSVALSGVTCLVGAPYREVDGEEYAGAAYVFISAPDIAGISPGMGPAGVPVMISGAGFAGTTAVSFNGTPAAFTVDSDAQISTAVPAGATSGPISVTNRAGSTTSHTSFTVIPAPSIGGIEPASGSVGTPVTISGSGFMWAFAVSFNGTDAPFEVDGGDIVTSVPPGATSGPVSVRTDGGTAVSGTDFTVIPTPSIARLRPASGKRGATVTITGGGFGAVRGAKSTVRFGGRRVTRYVSWSDARIRCKVPARAAGGVVRVSVATAGGMSNQARFRVRR